MLSELNHLMAYIEEHLLADLSPARLAKEIGFSEYHLKRTFRFIAGLSLSEYIKRRRLAKAQKELLKGVSVTTVAFKYGYQSVEGFSRAFHTFTGQKPSEIIKTQQQLAFPPLTFYLTVHGGTTMEFKIQEKPAFTLVGVTKRVPLQFNGVNPAISELAQSITPKQRDELHTLDDLYPHQVLNASYDFTEERLTGGGQLTHLIGFATSQDNPYPDLTSYQVPSHTWAIFPSTGPFPVTLQETWGKIYSEWLPTANYELVAAPEISFTRFSENPEGTYSEIWLAVKEK